MSENGESKGRQVYRVALTGGKNLLNTSNMKRVMALRSVLALQNLMKFFKGVL